MSNKQAEQKEMTPDQKLLARLRALFLDHRDMVNETSLFMNEHNQAQENRPLTNLVNAVTSHAPDMDAIKTQLQYTIDELAGRLPADINSRTKSSITGVPVLINSELRRAVTQSGVEGITFPEYSGPNLPYPTTDSLGLPTTHFFESGTQVNPPTQQGSGRKRR